MREAPTRWILFLALAMGCGAAAPATRELPHAVPLVIGNDAPLPLCGVFLRPTGSASFGRSRLGRQERVPPRTARTFFVDRGSWDILVQDCAGTTVSSGQGVEVSRHLGLRASDLTPLGIGPQVATSRAIGPATARAAITPAFGVSHAGGPALGVPTAGGPSVGTALRPDGWTGGTRLEGGAAMGN